MDEVKEMGDALAQGIKNVLANPSEDNIAAAAKAIADDVDKEAVKNLGMWAKRNDEADELLKKCINAISCIWVDGFYEWLNQNPEEKKRVEFFDGTSLTEHGFDCGQVHRKAMEFIEGKIGMTEYRKTIEEWYLVYKKSTELFSSFKTRKAAF